MLTESKIEEFRDWVLNRLDAMERGETRGAWGESYEQGLRTALDVVLGDVDVDERETGF